MRFFRERLEQRRSCRTISEPQSAQLVQFSAETMRTGTADASYDPVY